MGIIKSTGFVPGYGYVEDKNFIRHKGAIPKVTEKVVSIGEKTLEERSK